MTVTVPPGTTIYKAIVSADELCFASPASEKETGLSEKERLTDVNAKEVCYARKQT